MASRPDGVPADALLISGDGGLCKRVLAEGDATAGTPFDGAEVQVHYVGTLLSDGSKFDSSRDRPGNFSFKIGKGQVIKGWDMGVATMRKGEKAELFCRADYAYGETGSPPKIPGGATLKFEVELLSWAEPKKERWELSASEKLAEAARLKDEGGVAFKAGDLEVAHGKYTSAADWVDKDYDFKDDGDKSKAHELLAPCLLNAAQCSLKLQDWPDAAAVCTKALALEWLQKASRVKALFRRGSARIKLAEFADARERSARRAWPPRAVPNPRPARSFAAGGSLLPPCGAARRRVCTARARDRVSGDRLLTPATTCSRAGADLMEACKLDPSSKEIRDAYASIKEAEAAAKRADRGLFAKMVKGAGGVKRKPPDGVPADAVDISGDGGLCKRVLAEGDATAGTPFDGAEVQVHYVGTLLSDGSKFDSSRDRPGNFSFKIGKGQVIKGWDMGVATMRKGEKAELFCRADYAYGETGSPPKIPGGATLKFEVELLSWAEPK